MRCFSGFLFHHQTSTCIENVKFRGVNVDLLEEANTKSEGCTARTAARTNTGGKSVTDGNINKK